jgi:UDP-N-acetylglucosamine 2-epimerase
MADVCIFVGARPGYMKTWSVYQAFMNRGICPTVVATGQHHDILKQQQAILPMPISEWLIDTQPNVPLAQLYSYIYDAARMFLENDQPQAVFVNGDTTSALAVATAAFHLQIPIAHIESGLRSFNLKSPFPEEFNRISIDAMSTYLFAPTERAAKICLAINPQGKVCVTGNTVIDALRYVLPTLPKDRHCRPYILLDMHRRETSESDMERIVEIILEQTASYDFDIIWPAHPNPKVQAVALKFMQRSMRLVLLRPQPYVNFVRLMRDAELILTDSGGVVEEAITIGTPTLQLRDYTDRQEAIGHQYSWLATTNPDEVERILKIALLYAPSWKARMKDVKNPYGNGDAGDRSVEFFLWGVQRCQLKTQCLSA